MKTYRNTELLTTKVDRNNNYCQCEKSQGIWVEQYTLKLQRHPKSPCTVLNSTPPLGSGAFITNNRSLYSSLYSLIFVILVEALGFMHREFQSGLFANKQTSSYQHCWSLQYAGHVSHMNLCMGLARQRVCGPVVEHWSAESEGLRGTHTSFLSHACDKTKRHLSPSSR